MTEPNTSLKMLTMMVLSFIFMVICLHCAEEIKSPFSRIFWKLSCVIFMAGWVFSYFIVLCEAYK